MASETYNQKLAAYRQSVRDARRYKGFLGTLLIVCAGLILLYVAATSSTSTDDFLRGMAGGMVAFAAVSLVVLIVSRPLSGSSNTTLGYLKEEMFGDVPYRCFGWYDKDRIEVDIAPMRAKPNKQHLLWDVQTGQLCSMSAGIIYPSAEAAFNVITRQRDR